jgi:hypothetical protein
MNFHGTFFVDHFVALERTPKLKGAGVDRVRDEFPHTSGWCRLDALLIPGCCLLFGLLRVISVPIKSLIMTQLMAYRRTLTLSYGVLLAQHEDSTLDRPKI